MKPHKHKDSIIAWANGEQIQHLDGEEWINTTYPSWAGTTQYRIKPKPELKPGTWYYCQIPHTCTVLYHPGNGVFVDNAGRIIRSDEEDVTVLKGVQFIDL